MTDAFAVYMIDKHLYCFWFWLLLKQHFFPLECFFLLQNNGFMSLFRLTNRGRQNYHNWCRIPACSSHIYRGFLTCSTSSNYLQYLLLRLTFSTKVLPLHQYLWEIVSQVSCWLRCSPLSLITCASSISSFLRLSCNTTSSSVKAFWPFRRRW